MQVQNIEEYLWAHFGYKNFREGQRPIIEDVLNGNDVLGILPTGTGKSLCYQLPALIFQGATLVVSPLISLMSDQEKQLKAVGIKKVVAINSFLNPQERTEVLKRLHDYKLIYLSPEMLQNQRMLQALKKLPIDLFVIDEAHCISQWGHEFRTDYLKLDQIIHELADPPVLALSATATPEVQEDIFKQLKKPNMIKRVHSMDKINVSFAVEHMSSAEEKIERIAEILSGRKAACMIYFSSRQWAERAASALQQKLSQRIAFYHGGMEQTDRLLIQQQFMNDQLDIVCCTSAFGMGLDKPDIRYVIHFHVPTQIESFIQEVGRAGRDGKPCASLVLFTHRDYYLPQMLIQSELPETNELHKIFRVLDTFRNKPLPHKEEIVQVMELSESQWNFIKYQLEKHGCYSDGKISGSIEEWERMQTKVEQFLKERWHYKQGKLKEMINWVHHKGCKRKKLYEPFQDHIRPPYVPCCDSCGFNIADLQVENWEESSSVDSWQSRLRKMFQQEDHYEIF
ncbi:RecQ family ATP-dependent DNA helicase [Halobacillus salinarum]|uniref:RecQ family ATP-dependent DNA helicase n=1 Tax=Halobacillus salinarum TaxID=2932257 RepID=A0ABY4EDZ3_9BACI|nr:RecQ family ATP-dependent DNA helicase [Halobacillus salinarum]UOQ42675.1 RecQ family ATP-dependent DNA helicase [Halobacillus salinarum]